MPLGRRQPDSRYYSRRSVHSLCRRRALPSRGAGQNLPTRPSNSAAPDEARSPNILNLRRLLGGRALAHRLQAEAMSTALARDRAVPSIASDVNSTSFVQSPSQRSSAVPASQQTDSEPFSALLDAAAAAQQQSGAPASPPPTPQQSAISSPPQGSSFQSSGFQSSGFQSSGQTTSSQTATRNRPRPPRTAAILRRKPRRMRRANQSRVPTRPLRPRPLPATTRPRHKTTRRRTRRARAIRLRRCRRSRYIRTASLRPPILAPCRPWRPRQRLSPRLPNDRSATKQAATIPPPTTPRRRHRHQRTPATRQSNYLLQRQSSSIWSRPPPRRLRQRPTRPRRLATRSAVEANCRPRRAPARRPVRLGPRTRSKRRLSRPPTLRPRRAMPAKHHRPRTPRQRPPTTAALAAKLRPHPTARRNAPMSISATSAPPSRMPRRQPATEPA
jgi:hypothetical protein